MKLGSKSLIFAIGLAATALVTGCATPVPLGLVYTSITQPGTVGNGEMRFEKKGTAKSISLFALFASGDSSLNAACKEGGIRKINWTSTKATNFAGIYGSYETVVYGE